MRRAVRQIEMTVLRAQVVVTFAWPVRFFLLSYTIQRLGTDLQIKCFVY